MTKAYSIVPVAPDGPGSAAGRVPAAVGIAALGLGPLVLGTAVGLITNASGQTWYRRLAKPSWTPPDGVFGPVWTVLYLLMGLALVLVVRDRQAEPRVTDGGGALVDAGNRPDTETVASRRTRSNLALGAFATQLVLNLGWSILFFGARRTRLAAVEIGVLWGAIVATIVAFARIRPVAGGLLLPYLGWSTFAAALNIAIARRNP